MKYQLVHPAALGDLAGGAFEWLEAGRSVALLPPEGERPPLEQELPSATRPHLGVTSSGSTGRPKLVWWDWEFLNAGVSSAEEVRGWRWAAPYDPWSFAGVQVALQAWRGGGEAVSLGGNWTAVWRTLVEGAVDALSCTPTFADLLIQNEPKEGSAWFPRQLTLGGEPLRPRTGERLRRRWPQTRMLTVYASAEFGVLMKTARTDGWYELAGLEKRWPRWRIANGTLELGRPVCGAEVGGGWVSTGDRVEVANGLMRVVGRADQVANVAGSKVSLAEVAAAAEEVPGVRRAVATAISSPVTGQVVRLRFSPEPGDAPSEVQARLEAALRDRLPKPAWPRDWVVDEVGVTRNAKRAVR